MLRVPDPVRRRTMLGMITCHTLGTQCQPLPFPCCSPRQLSSAGSIRPGSQPMRFWLSEVRGWATGSQATPFPASLLCQLSHLAMEFPLRCQRAWRDLCANSCNSSSKETTLSLPSPKLNVQTKPRRSTTPTQASPVQLQPCLLGSTQPRIQV